MRPPEKSREFKSWSQKEILQAWGYSFPRIHFAISIA